jgi:hypothetical protein
MTEEDAIQVCNYLKKSSKEFNELLFFLRDNSSQESFNEAREYIAKIMTIIYLDLFEKIVKPDFPNLVEYMELGEVDNAKH